MLFHIVSILLILVFIKSVIAIECFNCESDFQGALSLYLDGVAVPTVKVTLTKIKTDFPGLRCRAPCTGEQCVVWKWNSRSDLLIKQGCLSGLDKTWTAKPGCRTNHMGASLCICTDGPRCNRIERADNPSRPLPQIRLPAAECSSRITSTGLIGPRREKICTANYCHVTHTETYIDHDKPDYLEMLNCGDIPEYDFDVRLKNAIGFPGLYANGCYRVQFDARVSHTDCFCSKNRCNEVKADIEPGHVRCYVGNMFTNTSQIRTDEFCDGDFCVIQKNGDHQVWKGCISVNERNSWSHLQNGYRQILSVEQYLCNSHLCNYDIERVLSTNKARQQSAKINHASHHNLIIIVILLLIMQLLYVE